MGQIQLTSQERVQALQRFDYSEPEAQFLCLAALHGGYFLRRQAAQFLAQQGGGSVTTLIEKTFADGHATATAYDRNLDLYHLCTRPFYAALGQEDNRNRRERECSTIKQKLMGLDFVLAHRTNIFLATEQEKVQYLSGTLGIAEPKFPARVYGSTKSAPTTRYFVEKYPIFLPPDKGPADAVSFCFVDEGLVTPSHFETFLEHYSRLFSALPAVHLVYIAARTAPFRWAENVFEKHVAKWTGQGVPVDPLVKRLSAYFALRRQYEAKDFDSLDRTKLIQLRNDQIEFSGRENEHLYDSWKAGGEIAVGQILAPESMCQTGSKISFSTYLLEHNYDFVGTITSR